MNTGKPSPPSKSFIDEKVKIRINKSNRKKYYYVKIGLHSYEAYVGARILLFNNRPHKTSFIGNKKDFVDIVHQSIPVRH